MGKKTGAAEKTAVEKKSPHDSLKWSTERLKTEREEEEQQNKSFFYVLGFIVLVLVALFFVPKFLPQKSVKTIDDAFRETLNGVENENQFMYNGFAFVYSDGLWYTRVMERNTVFTIPFHYSPRDVENVSLEGYAEEFMTYLINHPLPSGKKGAFITFDPADKNQKYLALANGELSLSFVKTTGVTVAPACTRNETYACRDLPIINCNETALPVIFFDNRDSGKGEDGRADVDIKRNCVTISGDGVEVVRAADRFLYELFGIME